MPTASRECGLPCTPATPKPGLPAQCRSPPGPFPLFPPSKRRSTWQEGECLFINSRRGNRLTRLVDYEQVALWPYSEVASCSVPLRPRGQEEGLAFPRSLLGPSRTLLAPEWTEDHPRKATPLGFIPGPVSLIVNPPERSKALRDPPFAMRSIKQTIYSLVVNRIQLLKGWGRGLSTGERVGGLTPWSVQGRGAGGWGVRGRSEGGGRIHSAGLARLPPPPWGPGGP